MCKGRVIYEADRDPAMNSTEKGTSATTDELAEATDPSKQTQIFKNPKLTLETVFHSPGFTLALW